MLSIFQQKRLLFKPLFSKYISSTYYFHQYKGFINMGSKKKYVQSRLIGKVNYYDSKNL
jgi:hypothetical protein